MRAVNKYATRTALMEWAGQSYVNKADGVSLDPRIESFGSTTRLAVDVQRFGSYLTTIYAYATAATRNVDAGRDVNIGSIVYGESDGALAFWSGSVWAVDSFVVSSAMRGAFTALQASLDTLALRLPTASRLVDPVYVAAFGNQVLLRRDGAVDVSQHHPAPLNQQFDTARTSPGGRFVEHIKPNGRAWFGPKEKRGLKAYAKIDSSSVSQVFLSSAGRGEFQVTFGANNCIAPTIEGSVLTWLEMAGGIATEHEMQLVGTLNLSAGVTVLNHILIHGQSNSYGSVNQPALSTIAPMPGRLKMLAGGQRSLGNHHNTGTNSVLPDQHIFPLADGAEITDAGSGESPATQLGYEFLSRRPAAEALVTSCHGIGGQGMVALRRGTLPYANMLKAVAWLRAACWIEGIEYRLAGMYLDQGENGITSTQSAKAAELTSFQSELTQDINAIRGGTSEVLVALVQTSNFTKYNVTTSGVPMAQLQLAIDQPAKFLCVGPRYTEETVVDGVHMVNEGSAFMGALGGRALADAFNGGNPMPLYVISSVRSGTSVVVTFNRNVEINTSLVTNPGTSGVTWIDDTSSATVSSVAAGPGASQVTVTLSAVPTGANPKIGIAALGTSGANGGPATGARSTIRDTSTDVSQRGRSMRRYASHQTPAVTI